MGQDSDPMSTNRYCALLVAAAICLLSTVHTSALEELADDAAVLDNLSLNQSSCAQQTVAPPPDNPKVDNCYKLFGQPRSSGSGWKFADSLNETCESPKNGAGPVMPTAPHGTVGCPVTANGVHHVPLKVSSIQNGTASTN